ncbi:MAG: outer membrane beta-barrel protein [Candidatus Thiodiazotropha sp.]
MKYHRSLIIAVSLLALTPVEGEEMKHWTLGTNLGVAWGDSGNNELSGQLSALGLDARANSSDDNRFAWQLRLGYDFTPRWGVELGYVDLGEVETTFTGTASDIDTFLSSSRHIHPNTADGFLISGVYRHPIAGIAQLEGVARAGGFIWSSEYDLKGVNSSRTVNENGTDLSFGLGLSLELDQVESLPSGMAAQFDWQRFDLADEWVDLFSLGLSYRFH